MAPENRMSGLRANPPEQTADELATRMVKLIMDLDNWILTLRKLITPSKPWQRALIGLLDEADRRMQILRMSEAMGKSDQVIVDATIELAAACRRLSLSIQGSRADAFIRTSAQGLAKASDALSKLAMTVSGLGPDKPS